MCLAESGLPVVLHVKHQRAVVTSSTGTNACIIFPSPPPGGAV